MTKTAPMTEAWRAAVDKLFEANSPRSETKHDPNCRDLGGFTWECVFGCPVLLELQLDPTTRFYPGLPPGPVGGHSGSLAEEEEPCCDACLEPLLPPYECCEACGHDVSSPSTGTTAPAEIAAPSGGPRS